MILYIRNKDKRKRQMYALDMLVRCGYKQIIQFFVESFTILSNRRFPNYLLREPDRLCCFI